MLKVSNKPNVQHELLHQFNKSKYNGILKIASVYKLTYKKTNISRGIFYHYIIN